MPGWSDVLAAVGGAAGGIDERRKFNESLGMKDKIAELNAMLRQVSEEGRNTRNTENNAARKEKADADRKQRADAVVANTDLGYTKNATAESLGWGKIDATERGQDLQEGRFWGGTMPFNYDALETRDATQRRGQDVGATTARRGQDMGASTAIRGQDRKSVV